MNEEAGNADDKPKPPPPDIPKGPPPPAPPIAADPPPKPPLSEPAGPPVQIGPAGGSGPRPSLDDDAPGSDASFNNRVIAAVIDGVVAGGLVLGLSIVIGLIPDFLGFATKLLDRVVYLLGLGYFLTRDSLPFLEGQSVGKKAMGIRAVTIDGKSLSGNWQPGVVRNVALVIPLFALVELFVMISRQDKAPPLLRLGDEWAKTKVINAGQDSDGAEEGAGSDDSGDNAGA